ncbi:MAG TPA: ABC transporter permease [Conexibacter sp.]|jgi:ABC-type dipeptide/oligopeptide/nickel transport system permease component|nr:ABC transporter permease [Conexibacter sp.]
MARLILSRLAQSVVVIFGALLISFLLAALAGNPARLIASSAFGFGPEQVQLVEKQLGYGDPLPVRFAHFMGNAVTGDFGLSYRSRDSALGLVFDALPNTLILVACALLLALAVAVPLAIFSVLRREQPVDRALRSSLVFAQGMPEFWLALVLVLLFSVNLGLLPSLGFDGPSALVLPTIALAIPLVPAFVRLTRGALLDVMSLEFITTVRAKGLPEHEVVIRHGLRNALPSLVTFLALQIGWLIGGTIIVEQVFSWPGMGTLALDAVRNRDLAIIQAIVVVTALVYVLMNLAADVLAALLDPRIRVEH